MPIMLNNFYAGFMSKHVRQWLKTRQPHIPDVPDTPTKKVVDIPELTQTTFEFNNAEQSVIIPVNDGYIVEGIWTAINAGEYIVNLKLNEGYIWSDNTTENKEINWSITQAENTWEIPPELNKTSWREDEEAGEIINIGKTKFGEVKVKLNDEDYDITNPLPTESNKQYELKFIVEETPNYEGLIQTITFEIIDRPDIAEPDITDKTYTGNPHYIITVDDTFTVEGDISATDVGEYSFTITPNDGYEWPDNTDNPKTFNWKIIKTTNEWITNPNISKTEWAEGDTSVTLTTGVAKFGEVVMKLNDEEINELPTAVGTYTIEFVVEGTNNYDGLSKSISFEIKPVLTLNSDYGEVITGLGENQDEVALVFKNSDLESMEWTVPCNLENIEILAVGGGGGGGGHYYNATAKNCQGGAGGGGGGVVTGYIKELTENSTVSITVGVGGSGGAATTSATTGAGKGGNGGNSVLKVGDVTYVTAYGGGGDGGYNSAGVANGGSNSGVRQNKTAAALKSVTVIGEGAEELVSDIVYHANKGGGGYSTTSGYPGAGGGGAGGAGFEAPGSAYGGCGGFGYQTTICGYNITFGAGGFGGSGKSGGVGSTSFYGSTADHSGAGISQATSAGTSGLANQGGGGGGGSYKQKGGNGGSGIVVLRFKANNLKIDPNVIKIKLTSPNVNSVIDTVSKKIVNDMKNDDVFLNQSTYYTYDTDYRKAAALESEKNSVPIEFNWLNTTGDTTLKLWRAKDIEADLNSEPIFQLTTSNTSAIYYDPEVGRNYTYVITDSNNNILSGNFYTAQLVPRVIYANQDPNTAGAEGSNTRDIGGWLTTDGTKMVKQGMIYRSAMLEWCSARENEKIIVPNIHLQDNLGIKVELDLRELNHIKTYFIDAGWKCSWKLDEPMTITDSTIGPKVERYCPNANGFAASPSYSDMFSNDANKKSVYASFNKIYESIINNKPILIHCSQGKDRTGCLAYILLGMLGVSETNARRDYAFTYYSQNKDDIYMSASGEGFYGLTNSILNKLPTGSTFQDRCKSYIKQCGEIAGDSEVDTKITNFIEFMLEDIEVF